MEDYLFRLPIVSLSVMDEQHSARQEAGTPWQGDRQSSRQVQLSELRVGTEFLADWMFADQCTLHILQNETQDQTAEVQIFHLGLDRSASGAVPD